MVFNGMRRYLVRIFLYLGFFNESSFRLLILVIFIFNENWFVIDCINILNFCKIFIVMFISIVI